MTHSSTGLHLHMVSLRGTRHICALWKIQHDHEPSHACAFSGAQLLPRQGPEQDWAVERTLHALRASDPGEGPACVSLALTDDGPRVSGVRLGVCASDLPLLTREAAGEGQSECAEEARTDPARFRRRAADAYRLSRHAACLSIGAPPEPSVGSRPSRVPALRDRLEESLPSFHSAAPGPGGQGGHSLLVRLLHERQSVVLRDYVRVRFLDDENRRGL